MQRYFAEPYVFRPPYRSQIWLRIAQYHAPLYLRWVLKLRRLEVRGVEHIRGSLNRKAGVILAPNHWSAGDGLLVAKLALQAGVFCYYLVSDHIFRQSRILAWLINRHGGYSVLREGLDRESFRASVQILSDAERPLVIFGEGTWYRQNDSVGPMQQGLALIALQAARHAKRPIVVHPVALKYWLLKDPRPGLVRRLTALEGHLGVPPSESIDLTVRVERATSGWLAAKERVHLGCERSGDPESRRLQLLENLISRLETADLGRTFDEPIMARVRRLRGLNFRRLTAEPKSENTILAAAHLQSLVLCEALFSHSLAYLRQNPTWERLAESVQRLEENVLDRFARPVAPMGAVVEAGPPIDVRVDRNLTSDAQRESLTARFAGEIQRMLDRLLVNGPPVH